MCDPVGIVGQTEAKREPRVCVLMPVFNGASFLGAAVESILKQTFKDFELLVVNDGSTDDTASILADYAKADVRVRVLNCDHGGLVAALTAGLKAISASVDYIARMDADDISLPTRLQEQVDFLDKQANVAVVGTAVEIFSDQQKAETPLTAAPASAEQKTRVIRHPALPGVVHWSMHFYCCIAHPTVMCRRAVLQANGYRSQFDRCEDYDLWMRLLPAHELANLDTVLLRLRKHASNVSAAGAGRASQKESARKLLVHHLERHGLLKDVGSPAPTTDNSAPSESAKHEQVERKLAIAHAIVTPSEAKTVDVLQEAFQLIQCIEQFVLGCKTTSAESKRLIVENATARLGEVALAAMKLDASRANLMWRGWMARDPKLALAALLKKDPAPAPAAASSAAATATATSTREGSTATASSDSSKPPTAGGNASARAGASVSAAMLLALNRGF